MSVRHTGTLGGASDSLSSTTFPTPTGDWIVGLWLKNTNYAEGPFDEQPTILSLEDAGGDLVAIQCFANTTLRAVAWNGTPDTVDILTGTDTGWVFVAIQHVSGSTAYTIRWRREGETSFTTGSVDLGVQIAFTSLHIGLLEVSGECATDACTRHFFFQSTLMDDATLLAASANIGAAPAGTNVHYLDLDSATDANVNGGTAGNWTILGTLTTDASEPAASLSGPGDPTLSPADNATGVSVTTNLVLSGFAENVQAGTGVLAIYRTSDNALIESITITDTGKVTFSSTTVTVNPATTLAYSTEYYVLVDSTAIESAVDSEPWAGISSTTAWSFTTEAAPAGGDFPTSQLLLGVGA